MDQRISLITLGVTDINRSAEFYESLGWQISSDESDEGIICFDLQSMALALYPWSKLSEDAGVPPNRSGASAIAIAHNVNTEDEVVALLEAAETAGANITRPAGKTLWGGFSGCFTDLDGIIWEIAYNPYSKLGPNGEFHWNGID